MSDTKLSSEVCTVSIVIPSFNYAHFLSDALTSCQNQTFPDIEVIVVDDGSTDNTREIVAQQRAVKYHYQSNSGLSAARNKGLDLASGKYIIFLDADDILLSSAVERCVRAFYDSPSAAFVVGRQRYIAVDETILKRPAKGPMHSSIYQSLLEHNFIACPGAVMYCSQILKDARGFDTALRSCEDYDVYLRLSRDNKVSVFTEDVVLYRVHQDGMSRNGKVMMATVLKVMDRQVPYVEGSEKLTAAYKSGLKRWKSYYGTAIATSLFDILKSGDFSRFYKESRYLLGISPWLFIKCMLKSLLGHTGKEVKL